MPERILKDGSVLVPLDEGKAREQVRGLKKAGVEAVAVCFLFSFVNRSTSGKSRKSFGRSSRTHFLSVSSEVLRSTGSTNASPPVCLNAYIGPQVATYVRRLEEELRALDVKTGVHLMTSASGVATAEAASKRPGESADVCPVAGVVGGFGLANRLDMTM